MVTATAHAIVAGAIAQKFPDPFLAPLLAFVSHFIMDAVPHWDFGTNWRARPKRDTAALAVGETLVGILIGFLLYRQNTQQLLLGTTIVFSLLPDWLEAPWYIFFARQQKHRPGPQAGFWEWLTFRIYKTENAFHTRAQYPLGLVTQIATVIFFVVMLA